jgi:regulator of sigma E protease
MLLNIVYLILAAFGLGVLVFIHELGHYFMARRVGMKVEAFGIGFGKPLYTWERKGVKWNFCVLPFGGYVRIAGMEKEGKLEPSEIPDGFFGKPPMARIKVAFMGPLVNIVFALLLFTVIWLSGGREKSFSEFTHLIGWIDPQSELYARGVRPGDEIKRYDHHAFQGFNDLLYGSLLKKATGAISGNKINYETKAVESFDYKVMTYPDPRALNPAIRTIGVLAPARYLIYAEHPNSLPAGSPMEGSGLEHGDRILWADGQLIFSKVQLIHLINEPKVLLTVQRADKVFLARVPRLKVGDLRLSEGQRSEIDDWQHEGSMKAKVAGLYFIPYNLTHEAIVQHPFAYLNENAQEEIYTPNPSGRLSTEIALEKGDRILAVDGAAIHSSAELLSRMQKRSVQIIVERKKSWPPVSWKVEDKAFDASIAWNDLIAISSTIGTSALKRHAGDFYLLAPVTPKPLTEFSFYTEKRAWFANELSERKKAVEEIEDPEERRQALQLVEENENRLMLGIVLQDRPVQYNPTPWALFANVYEQMGRTLKGLVTGSLSPKWMSGPVGIVQVFHYGWTVGVKEALFWMAVISLNLGLVNLLPLPVLDGGHILLSVIESVTKRPLKAKTMEWMFIPFIVLIVAAFVYFTYNDITRLLGKFF